MALLSASCARTLIVVKGGAEAAGGWFRSLTEGGTITSSTKTTMIWVLHVVTFVGTSTGNGFVNTGGNMRVNGVGGFLWEVRPTWSNGWILSAAVISSVPVPTVSGASM